MLRVPRSSTPLTAGGGLYTPAAHSGPNYLWISGAICRAPSTWEAATQKTSEPCGSQAHLPPKCPGLLRPFPGAELPSMLTTGAKNPSASSIGTHASSTVPTLGKAHSDWRQQPGISQNLEHQLQRQHPPGSLAYSSAWALSIPALHNIFHQRPQLVRTICYLFLKTTVNNQGGLCSQGLAMR